MIQISDQPGLIYNSVRGIYIVNSRLHISVQHKYSKPKVTYKFLLLNTFIPVSIWSKWNISLSVQDLSEQISGKMIHASDSTIELSVLTLKTNILHFLTHSSVDHGFGHKTIKTVDFQ